MRKTKEEIIKERDAAERAAENMSSKLSWSEKREADLKDKIDEMNKESERAEIMNRCRMDNVHEHMRFLENLIEANTDIKLRSEKERIRFNPNEFI